MEDKNTQNVDVKVETLRELVDLAKATYKELHEFRKVVSDIEAKLNNLESKIGKQYDFKLNVVNNSMTK